MSGKVKVAGYSKKTTFNGNIEYRPFSPDLVGVQIASDGGTPLFTMGNFSITTNMEPKSNKTFITKKFSNFISLTDLDLTLDAANKLLIDNAGVLLNLNKNNLKYYAQFGSLGEFVRVSLENIITTWPASLYATRTSFDTLGNVIDGKTYEDYSYDNITNISSFKINTTFINNKFQINYLKNGTILDTFNSSNDLRNITVNYKSYAILINDTEYPVLGFTGSDYLTNDYVYFNVEGNPFTGTSSNLSYHIKPNKITEETFFNSLPDFEAYLLNRLITPKYTAVFKYSIKSEEGAVLYVTDSITWPTSDNYNIDFDTSAYVDYATKLVDISTNNDLTSSDLMNRFLVSESISSFDTAPVNLSYLDQDSTGQKMTKTLHIYGRNIDEINNYIEGIAFANTVTYDKQDNIPDIYIKNLARVFGWELISSVLENSLLSSYVTTAPSTYSGQTVGLTPIEADIELWRRLILNSPWLWKSKGARKSIEFLLRFIGVPNGLVTFNEYIYKAEQPIDIDLFRQVLVLNGLDDTDLSIYPIDSEGYPAPLADSNDMYFQNYGLWYRETGGSGSTIDILTGNNPHLGPYDGGYKYINQFTSLIPNYSAVTVSSETKTTEVNNLFINYNVGQITDYSGKTYVNATYSGGTSIDDCIVVDSTIIADPIPHSTTNDCGCSPASADDSLSVCLKLKKPYASVVCDKIASPCILSENGNLLFVYNTYNVDGNVIYDNLSNKITNTSQYGTKECCTANLGVPTIYSEVTNDVVLNTGYVCCKTQKCGCWVACKWLPVFDPILLPIPPAGVTIVQDKYLEFIKDDGSIGVTTPDGSNCLSSYTIATPNINDPYTGEIGFGCKLTTVGVNDLKLGSSSIIYNHYLSKKNGTVSCCV